MLINLCLKHLFYKNNYNILFLFLKKELLKIPIFGWYLKKIDSIDIVRDTTTRENLNFFENIKKQLDKSNRPLLIFPRVQE